MIKHIDITDEEILEHMAEANVRKVSRYPRCDCKGNKILAGKWKRDAKADVCTFIKGQYGKAPRDLDSVDRRAMKRDCAPYLPVDKMKMLTKQTGRPAKTFWADFCDTLTTTKSDSVLPTDKVLKLFQHMFPKTNGKAKKLEDVTLSRNQRLHTMADSMLMVRISPEDRRKLGLSKKTALISQRAEKKLSPAMSVPEAESFIENNMNKTTPGTVTRDHVSGRLVITSNPNRRWNYIARTYGHRLPQKFLDLYSAELVPKRAGRKPTRKDAITHEQTMLENAKRKAAKEKAAKKAVEHKPIKHDLKKITSTKPASKKQNQDTDDDDDDDDSDLDEFGDWDLDETKKVVKQEEKRQSLPVPASKITTPERLQLFINNVMKKHDDTYGLSTSLTRWSNPEWSLVDVYRDDISKDLLTKYASQIDQARRILGARSGGAYAGMRDNRQLCVAHVITSWMCGELI